MSSSLYGEIIIDHYRNPRNFGALKNPTHTFSLYNPFCGDRIIMDVVIKNKMVKKIAFSGSGCAISQAASSLLTEYAHNKKISLLITLDQSIMLDMLGIELGPVRLKCALLCFETLQRICKKSIQ